MFFQKNDTISIKSFLTLKLPVLLYSRINLPATSILKRYELNNTTFSYWKIFNNNTNVRTVVIDAVYVIAILGFVTVLCTYLDCTIWASHIFKYMGVPYILA